MFRRRKPPEGEDPAEREPAKGVALRMLARRGLTRPELRERLDDRGYGAEEIDGAIASLEAGGWLPPDEEVARSWAGARARRSGVGRSRLAREIGARGLPSATASRLAGEALPAGDEEALLTRELERAIRSVKESVAPSGPVRRSGRSPGAARAARIFARLLRRGFAPDAIRKAMGRAGLFAPSLGDGEGERDPGPSKPQEGS